MVKSAELVNRKVQRKAERLSVKVKRAFNYAKRKKTKKVCLSSKDIDNIKALQNNSLSDLDFRSKIFSNDKNSKHNFINTNGGKKKRKIKRNKKIGKSHSVDDDGGNGTEESSSFKMADSTNARLARLQEFVNRESIKSTDHQLVSVKRKNLEVDNLKKNNLIKDESELISLRLGQKKDDKEIKDLSKIIGINSKQRKLLRDTRLTLDFGDILADIEAGTMPQKENVDLLTNYDSDERFEKDFLNVLGKSKSRRKKKENKNSDTSNVDKENLCIDEQLSSDESGYDDDETVQSNNINDSDKSDEDDDSEDHNNVLDDKAEDDDFEHHNSLLDDEDDDFEHHNSLLDDEDDDFEHHNGLIDDEAEEDDEYDDESEQEPFDDKEEIAFESGSTMTKATPSSNNVSMNSIFDAFETDSEEYDTDLEGFIVGDDCVEYDTEETEEEIIVNSKPKAKRDANKELNNSTLNDNNTNKFKRIIVDEESEVEEKKSPIKEQPKKKRKIANEETNSIDEKNTKETSKLGKNNKKKLTKINPNTENKVNLDSSNENLQPVLNGPKKRVRFSLIESEEEEIGESDLQATDKKDENEIQATETYHEDIYGRLRDTKGNIIDKETANETNATKYIPPAMRKLMELNQSEKKREQLAALRRNLKGLLNRLTESNIQGILSQVERYYHTNSNNDMNDTLTQLLYEAFVGPVLSPARMIQENALLIAGLSANVGSEVGAHILTEFVLKWVERYEDFLPSQNISKVDSKELDNLILFISYLYEFGVVDATLIYDLLTQIHEKSLGEKQIDLILHVLRNVGFNLRKDDPLALKGFITRIQTQVAEEKTSDSTENLTRIRFLLEILTAIKNNNVNKVPNYDSSRSQDLKTLMRGLIREGCSAPDLKVTLNDLVKSKIVGKWWVVGGAWSGGLKENMDSTSQAKLPDKHLSAVSDQFSDAFKRKAEKLQLTRIPRINIFYALTEGSTDSEEATERILELRIHSSQESDIFNVIIHILLRLMDYTDFYYQVVVRLCKSKNKYGRLLRGALFGKFKGINSMKPKQVSNLAKFVAQLITDSTLDLSMFKKLEFSEADAITVSFIRQVLMGIFMNPTGNGAVQNVFNRLCSNPNQKQLRQHLRLFIEKFIPCKKTTNNDEKMLKARVKLACEILTSVGGVRL